MKWLLFAAMIFVVLYQYNKGLISVADADTGGFWALSLGLIKL